MIGPKFCLIVLIYARIPNYCRGAFLRVVSLFINIVCRNDIVKHKSGFSGLVGRRSTNILVKTVRG